MFGFVDVEQIAGTYPAISIAELVKVDLSILLDFPFCHQRNSNSAGLYPIQTRLIFIIECYLLQNDLAKKNYAFTATDVYITLFSYLIPYAGKVLNIDMDIIVGDLTREREIDRQMLEIAVKFIAVLSGHINACITDIYVTSLLVWVFIEIDVPRDQFLIGVTTHIELLEIENLKVISVRVVEIGNVWLFAPCDNVAHKNIFAGATQTANAHVSISKQFYNVAKSHSITI